MFCFYQGTALCHQLTNFEYTVTGVFVKVSFCFHFFTHRESVDNFTSLLQNSNSVGSEVFAVVELLGLGANLLRQSGFHAKGQLEVCCLDHGVIAGVVGEDHGRNIIFPIKRS